MSLERESVDGLTILSAGRWEHAAELTQRAGNQEIAGPTEEDGPDQSRGPAIHFSVLNRHEDGLPGDHDGTRQADHGHRWKSWNKTLVVAHFLCNGRTRYCVDGRERLDLVVVATHSLHLDVVSHADGVSKGGTMIELQEEERWKEG